MSKDMSFENFVEELQQKIEHEEENTYSKKVIQEYRNPDKFGIIKNPDATGKIKGPCNDTMKISIKINDKKISDSRFWTDGCGATIACGNMLMKVIKNKTINEAKNISSKKLIDILDGLPKEHLHCAKLAVDTLHSALKNLEK